MDNIKSAQGSMLDILKEDVKEASLQLSHFVFVNNGEYMELAAEADTDDIPKRNQAVRKLEDAFQVAMTPKQDIISSQFYMKDGRRISIKDDTAQSAEEIKESSWYRQALESPGGVCIGTYDTGKLDVTYFRQRKWEFIIVAALAPNITIDRSEKVELVSLFYRSTIADLIRDYEQTGRGENTVILDKHGEIIYQGRSANDGEWYLDIVNFIPTGTLTADFNRTQRSYWQLSLRCFAFSMDFPDIF